MADIPEVVSFFGKMPDACRSEAEIPLQRGCWITPNKQAGVNSNNIQIK
jgi:hypothetical protein